MTRAESGLRRATVAFVCAVIIVTCIWLLGVLFGQFAPLPSQLPPATPAEATLP